MAPAKVESMPIKLANFSYWRPAADFHSFGLYFSEYYINKNVLNQLIVEFWGCGAGKKKKKKDQPHDQPTHEVGIFQIVFALVRKSAVNF